MALYYCRMQASKHAIGTRLPVHWTLKCYAKNLSKESLRPLVETRTKIAEGSVRSIHYDYLVYYLECLPSANTIWSFKKTIDESNYNNRTVVRACFCLEKSILNFKCKI